MAQINKYMKVQSDQCQIESKCVVLGDAEDTKSRNNVGENVVQIILVDFMSFSDLDY